MDSPNNSIIIPDTTLTCFVNLLLILFFNLYVNPNPASIHKLSPQ